MSNSLHIGQPGSLTDLSTYGLTVERGPWSWMPPPRGREVSIPRLDGGHLEASAFDLRQLQAECVVKGDDSADLLDKMDSIRELLDGRGGDQAIRFDLWADRYFVGRCWEAIEAPYAGMHAVRFRLVWRCSEALALAVTASSDTETISADPHAYVIAADGTAEARPRYELRNTSGSASDALKLISGTTGEQISLNAGIPNGTWIRFDLSDRRNIIEKSTDSGSNWEPAMNLLGDFKRIPHLRPGNNSITLYGLASGSLVTTWRNRYI